MRPSNPPLLQRTVHNSTFSGLGTVSTFVLGFVFAGLTVRYLGESRAGYLLTLQALIGLSAVLGGFGLATPSIRRVAILHGQGDLATARAVVGSVSTVNTLVGVLLSPLIVIFFPAVFAWSRLDAAYLADAFWTTLFVAGSFLLTQAMSPWEAVYQATLRYKLIAVLATVFGLLSAIAGIVVLTVTPSMSAISATAFAVNLIRLVCDAYFVRRLLQRVPLPTWAWGEIRPMLGFGGWTYLGSLGILLFTNMDRLVLATFLGSAAVPYYALPQRLYSQIHLALASQSQFLFPMLSAYGDRAAAQIEKVEDRLRWFVALVSGATYVGLAIVGPAILSGLVSPEFAGQATLPLTLACAQGFFHAQMTVPYFSSWAVGDGRPNAILPMANGVLVITSSVLLIPRFGFVGASLAQLWIVAMVLVHTSWVRRIVSPQLRPWGWLSALVSPSLMVLSWLSVTRIGMLFVSPDSVASYMVVLTGGMVGLAVLWSAERVLFPNQNRWTTLMRAVEMLFTRMNGRAFAR